MSNKVWYYRSNSESIGPYTLQTFTELILASEIKATTLVLREGSRNWMTANVIPEFSHLFPNSSLPPADDLQQSESFSSDFTEKVPVLNPQESHNRKIDENYFVKHWNGNNTLAWAWWVNGALVNVLMAILNSFLSNSSFFSSPWVSLTYIILLLLIYLWQVVGIVRSAGKFISQAQSLLPHKSIFWARAAVVMVVLGVLSTIGTYGPLIQDVMSLISLEDSDISQQYFIEYAGTTDVHLTGYINGNSVSAIKQAFTSDSRRTALVLDSPGGILFDAFELADFIVEKELIVGTTDSCISACVLLLAASPRSLASPNAELIFHRPEDRADFTSTAMLVAGVAEEQEYYKRFEDYGMSAEFIEKFKRNEFTQISIGEAYEAAIVDFIWEEESSTLLDPSELCQRVDCFQIPIQIGEIESDVLNVFSLEVGTCFDDKENNGANVEYFYIDPISCTNLHDNEVFSTFDLALDQFPGDEEINQISTDECLNRFESYVGLDFASSAINLFPLYPTSTAWEQGQRKVSCIGYDMNLDKLSSSIKDLRI